MLNLIKFKKWKPIFVPTLYVRVESTNFTENSVFK